MRLYRYITLFVILLTAGGFVRAISANAAKNALPGKSDYSVTAQKHLVSDHNEAAQEIDLTVSGSSASQHGVDKRNLIRAATLAVSFAEITRHVVSFSQSVHGLHSHYLKLLFPFHNFW